jgi:hypothetical protein
LPTFHPENIFRLTHSRLQTSSGVLQTRLAALRALTPDDHALRRIFDSTPKIDPRLLYAQFGPRDLIDAFPLLITQTPNGETLARDAGTTLLYFALPSHLLPHIAHLLVIGIATSTTLAGSAAARWRSAAIIASLTLCAAEIYLLATYDDGANRTATRISETDFLHWKLLLGRGLGGTAIDALLGWAIYAGTTGRGGPDFLTSLARTPESPEARLAQHGAQLENALRKIQGLGVLRNALVRDPPARERSERYWVQEGEVMKDVFETREVVEALRGALGRTDVARVGRDADEFVDGVLAPMRR